MRVGGPSGSGSAKFDRPLLTLPLVHPSSRAEPKRSTVFLHAENLETGLTCVVASA